MEGVALIARVFWELERGGKVTYATALLCDEGRFDRAWSQAGYTGYMLGVLEHIDPAAARRAFDMCCDREECGMFDCRDCCDGIRRAVPTLTLTLADLVRSKR